MSGRHYDTLRVLDETVAKALKVREVARIARIETLMRQYLAVEWDRLAVRASKSAVAAVRRGHVRLTETDIKAVGRAVDKVMSKWASEVTPRFVDDCERIYRLARQAGARKASGQTRASLGYDTEEFPARVRDKERMQKQDAAELAIDFDLVDEQAVAALKRNQTFWIGEHYGANVSGVVSASAREAMVEQGFGRVAAGAVMRETVREALRIVETPTGWRGTDKQYFEGLSANAATTARVQGHVKSFAEFGVERLRWFATGGVRMCGRCGLLDGKIFEVSQAQEQIRRELDADHPDDIRDIRPWLTKKQLLAISDKPGHVSVEDSKRLAEAGQAVPPAHFR